MKSILFIIIFILIFSCQQKVDKLREGIYASKYPSRIELLYQNYISKTGRSMGDTLTIIDSNLFNYRSCGTYSYGSYKIVENILILNIDSFYTHR